MDNRERALLRAMADDEPKVVRANAEKAVPLTVETTDNHVYFYATVDEDRVLALIKSLRELDTRLRLEAIDRGRPDSPDPIWLHINSGGGYSFDGNAATDFITTLKTPVYTLVEGYAGSAAVDIVLAGRKRFITPQSFMMIHEFSHFVWGKYKDFEDAERLHEMLWDQMVDYMASRTKLTKAKLREMLRHDWWMNAAEALEHGFVDEILT